MKREPWVNLGGGDDLYYWERNDQVAYNQTMRQNEKHRFYQFAFDYLQENGIKGDYYEFGCHRARTFRMALTEARRQNMDKMHFHAFDSFEGLPPNDSGKWQEGSLCTTEDEFTRMIADHGIYVDKVHIHKGFYDDTLPRTKLDNPAAFVCVDCDLHDSAAEVFRFIVPYLQEGTLIYIDDLFVGDGVANAWIGFKTENPFAVRHFVPHMNVGWWGRSFIAV